MSKKAVGLIPIKFNNQRLPGKNTKDLMGHPLCSYVFNTVKEVKNLNDVYVICSDEKICEYLPKELKFLKRPTFLDGSEIKSKQILDWFIGEVDADVYSLMHCTQPFIKKESIEIAVEKVLNEDYDSAFCAREIKEFAWYDGKTVNYDLKNVVKTQDLKPIYIEGEVFVFEKGVLTKKGRRIGEHPYIHPIGWKEGICIDEMEDFRMAQAVLSLEREEELDEKK